MLDGLILLKSLVYILVCVMILGVFQTQTYMLKFKGENPSIDVQLVLNLKSKDFRPVKT